ncbi:MAG: helix-turn-helix domain-containing protein, partial [Saprospiraceae bacterium]
MGLMFEGFAPCAEQGWGGRPAEPVRRHSRPKGRFEGMFWRPFKPKDVARFLTAAERFERAGKKPGARNGPLGTVAIEVLRELLRLVDYRTGRLEPALLTLMARTRRSKDAVVRALAALRRYGFVDWVRRYIPTGNRGPGPQVQQTSNAYRLALPPAAERLLGRAGEDAPMPDDYAHALETRQAERQAQLAGTDPEERNAALFGS